MNYASARGLNGLRSHSLEPAAASRCRETHNQLSHQKLLAMQRQQDKEYIDGHPRD